MSSSSNSSFTPPRAAFQGSSAAGDDSTRTIHPPLTALPRWKQVRLADAAYAKYGTVELQLLRVVTTLSIPIIPPSEITTHLGESSGYERRRGHSLEVYPAQWRLGSRSVPVALKRMRARLTDGLEDVDAMSRAQALTSYGTSMVELMSETEIMGSLGRHHRNITRLLGISFDMDSTSTPPVLVVELADERHPDLDAFFKKRKTEGSGVLCPLTASSILSDVADGIAALHARDFVHADIKPSNILLFRDEASPCGLVAKVSDFGFSGKADWTLGIRIFHAADRPRGGTVAWDAPECHQTVLVQGNNLQSIRRMTREPQAPSDMSPRDVYSFGLLCSFVALDGEGPADYIPSLMQAKLADIATPRIIDKLEQRLRAESVAPEGALLIRAVQALVFQCLAFDPAARLKDLSLVRSLLAAPSVQPELLALPPRPDRFFETFPATYDEFAHSGLEAAYLASPRPFRQRVVDSFAHRKAHPLFPQPVPMRVWEALLNAQENPA